MLRAAEVARAAFPKASVVNMLQLPGGSPSKQVMLQVRFAEVNRNALLQAGITLFTTRAAFTSRSHDAAVPGAGLHDEWCEPVAAVSATCCSPTS